MLAEVPELEVPGELPGDECARGLRYQHLAAMAGGGDPGDLVERDPDVAAPGRGDVTRVDTYPNLQLPPGRPGMTAECSLSLGRGHDRRGRFGEHDEDSVTLGAEQPPAMAGGRRLDEGSMLGQNRAVPIAELAQQARRALNIGEHESDRARREIRRTTWTFGRHGSSPRSGTEAR